MGVKSPESSPTENRPVAVSRHSRAGGNPAGQGAGGINTPSPSIEEEPAPSEGRGWDGGEEPQPSTTAPTSKEVNLTDDYPESDDHPDCYHEPLNPEQQAIFDYQTQIESGEYEPGEITIRQPTPEDWKSFEQQPRPA